MMGTALNLIFSETIRNLWIAGASPTMTKKSLSFPT